MSGNTRFSYLYRDAGNYKKSGRVVFSNPDNLRPILIEKALRQSLSEECLFVASQIRVPECFLYARGDANSDDHCFHEFEQVDETAEETDDLHQRSISQFVEEVKRQAKLGWGVFDPHER